MNRRFGLHTRSPSSRRPSSLWAPCALSSFLAWPTLRPRGLCLPHTPVYCTASLRGLRNRALWVKQDECGPCGPAAIPNQRAQRLYLCCGVDSMKIALAQINTTVGDFGGNVERIMRFAGLARERGADLVVFPELALCGYPPRDLVEKPSFIERSEAELEQLARMLPDPPVLAGYVRRSGVEKGKAVADAAALLHHGKD